VIIELVYTDKDDFAEQFRFLQDIAPPGWIQVYIATKQHPQRDVRLIQAHYRYTNV